MESKLSKYLAGFRRNHNIQHALFRIIKSWRALQNKSQKVGAIMMDLSTAFDTLKHFTRLTTFLKIASLWFR